MAEVERITMNLTTPAKSAMKRAMDVTGENKTETMNHALILYALVCEAQSNGGSVHIQRDKDAQKERILIL